MKTAGRDDTSGKRDDDYICSECGGSCINDEGRGPWIREDCFRIVCQDCFDKVDNEQ